jgi:hypothetical protein
LCIVHDKLMLSNPLLVSALPFLECKIFIV